MALPTIHNDVSIGDPWRIDPHSGELIYSNGDGEFVVDDELNPCPLLGVSHVSPPKDEIVQRIKVDFRRLFESLINNPPVRATYNGERLTVTEYSYRGSIIPSEDYSRVSDHRPVKLELHSKVPIAVMEFEGFNRLDSETGAMELLPLGDRPSVPFSLDLQDSRFDPYRLHPFFPLLKKASHYSDLLDALAAVVREIKEKIDYQINGLGRTPEQTWAEGFGSCDDFTPILMMVCDWMGLECEYASGPFFDANYKGVTGWAPHAWPMVKVGDKWIPLDATLGPKGSPVNGDDLWKVASATYWIPFAEPVIPQWSRIQAIKPTENMGYIEFDTVQLEWNAVDDLVERLNFPTSELREYLIDHLGFEEALKDFEPVNSRGHVVKKELDTFMEAHPEQYQQLYIEAVLANWLAQPDQIADPLYALDRLHDLLSYESWDKEVYKQLSFAGLYLLTLALADAEAERFDEVEGNEFITTTSLYEAYQKWQDLLPPATGFAPRVYDEWERRLRYLYEQEGESAPDDLKEGTPFFGHFNDVLQLVKQERTPSTVRRYTQLYTNSRSQGVPNLKEDAKIFETEASGLELTMGKAEDFEAFSQLYHAMAENPAEADSVLGDRFEAYEVLLSGGNAGMSLLALVLLRNIYLQGMERRLVYVLNNGLVENQPYLDETLDQLAFLYEAHLNERVILEAQSQIDCSELKSRVGFTVSRAYTKMMSSSLQLKWSDDLHKGCEKINDTSVKEHQLVGLDFQSHEQFEVISLVLNLVAHKMLIYANAHEEGSPEREWALDWLARYQVITGEEVSVDNRFDEETLMLFLPPAFMGRKEDILVALGEEYPEVKGQYSLMELGTTLQTLDEIVLAE